MNFKPLVFEKLREFSEMPEFKDYSVGELLYSVLTQLGDRGQFRKSTLLRIEDGSFYTMIEKAIKLERNDDNG